MTKNPNDTFDPATVTWVMDETSLEYLLMAIETCIEVVVDLETTGLDEHATTGGQTNGGVSARIALGSYTLPQPDDAGEPTTWVVPGSHPDSPWLGKWREVFGKITQTVVDCRKPVVNQNMKFDSRWLTATTGADLSTLIEWDTQISSHLLDENESTKLKERAPATFGVERWDDHDLSYPGAAEEVPMLDLGLYAARDTYWTWKLAVNHRDRMLVGQPDAEPETPDEVEEARLGLLAQYCDMPSVKMLTAMEQRGFGLDVEWVNSEIVEHTQKYREAYDKLVNLYPESQLDPADASFAPTSNWFRAWTDAAVQAGDLVVGALTSGGKPQWSKSVLLRLSHSGHPVAQTLLDLRGHSKKLEFLKAWLVRVTPADKIHSNYNQGSVVTGRLSSSSPNLQQVTSSLRPAFIPPPGHVVIDLDYSQIELRVAAFIARCQPMIEAFQNGDDLHRILAGQISHKPIVEVTKDERQKGKSANFGLLYGMTAYGFKMYAETAYDIVITEEESVDIHQAFFDTWEGIGKWHTRSAAKAHRVGQVSSPLGRVRRLPMVWSNDPKTVAFAERAAVNSPVQGMAADLMKMASCSIDGLLPGYPPVDGAQLVATVHDSVVVIAPEERWEEVARECKARMEGIVKYIRKVFGVDFDVPLIAEATVGTRWGLSDIGVIE